jgi:hypothetical protein
MWFFASEEAEEYRSKKRRKLNEDMRDARLRQIAARTNENLEELWGGSDEEVFAFHYKLRTPNNPFLAR